MRKGSYYKEKLSATKLARCYEIAPPRIKQYLNAEIRFVISNLRSDDLILELGCGHGRVLQETSRYVSWTVGIDISKESLRLAQTMENCQNCTVSVMDASQTAFHSNIFDVVFCIQNGISAFCVHKDRLIAESIRITKESGIILFSSYSPKIWPARLEWFNEQSRLGLIGEIDEEKTCDGTIVCKDGFKATTVTDVQFAQLFHELGMNASIIEVDESSIFCKVVKER